MRQRQNVGIGRFIKFNFNTANRLMLMFGKNLHCTKKPPFISDRVLDEPKMTTSRRVIKKKQQVTNEEIKSYRVKSNHVELIKCAKVENSICY
jgi:hypothetical protein